MGVFYIMIGIILVLVAFCLVELFLSSLKEKAYAKAYQERIDDIKIGDVYEWNKNWDGIRCANWHDVWELIGEEN